MSKRKDSRYRSGTSTNWLKAKCYAIGEFDLLGVEREAGKPAFALMAERGTGRYVGSAFITLNLYAGFAAERIRKGKGRSVTGITEPNAWFRF